MTTRTVEFVSNVLSMLVDIFLFLSHVNLYFVCISVLVNKVVRLSVFPSFLPPKIGNFLVKRVLKLHTACHSWGLGCDIFSNSFETV